MSNTTKFIIDIDQKPLLNTTELPSLINSFSHLKYFPYIIPSDSELEPQPGKPTNFVSREIIGTQTNKFFSGLWIGENVANALQGLAFENYQNIQLLQHTATPTGFSTEDFALYFDNYKVQIGSKIINLVFINLGESAGRPSIINQIKNILNNVNQKELFYLFAYTYPYNIAGTQLPSFYPSNPKLFNYYPGPYDIADTGELAWNSVMITNNLIDIPEIKTIEPTNVSYGLFNIENLIDPKQNAFKYNVTLNTGYRIDN